MLSISEPGFQFVIMDFGMPEGLKMRNANKTIILKERGDKKRGSRDQWFAHAISVTIAVIAAAASLSGAFYQYKSDGSQISEKYIEVAIKILSGPKSPASSQNDSLRIWALDVVNKYSEVKLNESAREEIEKFGVYGQPYKYNISLQDRGSRGGNIYLSIDKKDLNGETITKIEVDAGQCASIFPKISEYAPDNDTVVSLQSYVVRLISSPKLIQCLQANGLVERGYVLADVNTQPVYDTYQHKGIMDVESIPFTLSIEAEERGLKRAESFGAYAHFISGLQQ